MPMFYQLFLFLVTNLYRGGLGWFSSSELPHYLMWRIWVGNQLSFIIKAVLEAEDKPSQSEI